MNPTTHIKVLYLLLAMLFIVVGYSLYQNKKPASSQTVAQVPSVANIDTLAGITVGSSKAAPYVSGTITSISSGSIRIKDAQTGATQTVALTSSTVVKLNGALKDPVTQQKELDAYNARAAELLKDPIKNKAALAAMQMPATSIITSGSMSDLAVGDSVYVILSDTTATPTATVIHKNTLTASLQ